MAKGVGDFSCPSAQPDMADARVIGVLSGTADATRIAYLKQEAVIDARNVPDTAPLRVTEVFRFAARCEADRCG